MKNTLENLVSEALLASGIQPKEISVEHPDELSHGDYMTNAALVHAKEAGMSPQNIAEQLHDYIESHKPIEVERVEIAGPGFINFYLSKEFFKQSIGEIIRKGDTFGRNTRLDGEKIIVEHTDPNPFKEFHIGHLMPNVVGSTLARIFEWNGAEVKQANYQGDAGMHVAKAVWSLLLHDTKPSEDLLEDAKMLGAAYAEGAKAFDGEAADDIKALNKKIYDRSDEKVNRTYDTWRKISLDYFDVMYEKLGTKFDYFFFESETGKRGKEIVEKYLGEVFEKSDGAIVFHAEKYDPSLHTRVFINSEGLPTYEAKELGLAQVKYEKYPYTKSIVVTGNEINDYFRVLLAAMKYVYPDLREKTKHISHGMLRLPTGKMSSRTGDVITAEWLINTVREVIATKGTLAELPSDVQIKTEEKITVGAVKYMILRQSIGNDIVFDYEKSVSTEGDSGPYLQYAYARTRSVLEKANKKGDASGPRMGHHDIERLLYRFPEVLERASKEYAPHYITTYLIELAGTFNNFYAKEQIIADDPESLYRLAITEAFNTVIKNGLTVLGIPVVEKM